MKRLLAPLALPLIVSLQTARAECPAWIGFHAPVRYSSLGDRAILVRDLNGDGAPDIIASGNHVDEIGTFSLFTNRGDGTFAPERLQTAGFGEEIEDAADLDGDGALDLLASNYWSNGISVYRGLGELRFDGGTPYATATHGGPSLFVDYDHDGAPDIISLSFGSGNPVRVHLFRGSGGALTPKVTFETSLANGRTPSVRERDGSLEVLIGEGSGHLGILRYADGALSMSTIAVGPGFDLHSTFADVDGDSIADIVYTTDSPSIAVMIANADGTFRERRELASAAKPAFPVDVVAGDFDRDGRADLIVSDFRMPALYFFRGKGDGDFEEGRTIDAGGPVHLVVAADVNRDGNPDLVTANDDQTLSVLVNGGPCPLRRRAARP